MPEVYTLIAIIAVLVCAAFVQSATGFGLALVCMAGLPLVMSVNEAVTLVAAYNLLVNANIIFLNRAGLSWSKAWPLVASVIVGIPLGYYGMKHLEGESLIRLLGLVLIAIAVSDLRFSLKKGGNRDAKNLPRWSAFPIGLGGGVLGGAFNVGGPPIVAYVYSQNWPKAQSVAVLQTSFLAGGITRNILMGANGDYSRQLFATIAWAAIPTIAAIWLGKKALDRLPQEVLRRIVFIFVLAMGIKYLVWP